MPINKETVPPPLIGKIGPYTVFMTPPSTPTTTPTATSTATTAVSPPPVVPPPQQYDCSKSLSHETGSVAGFFKNAVTKVQNAHSSLDDYMARWLGLNQSKYQWALDDYYESKGFEKGGMKTKEVSSKLENV